MLSTPTPKVDIGITRARSAYPKIFEKKQLAHVRSISVLSGCIIAQGIEKFLVTVFSTQASSAYTRVQAGPRYAEHDVREQEVVDVLWFCGSRGILMAGR